MSVIPWGNDWKKPNLEKLDFIPSEFADLPKNAGGALIHDCRVLIEGLTDLILPLFENVAEKYVVRDQITKTIKAACVMQYQDGTARGIWLVCSGSFIEANLVERSFGGGGLLDEITCDEPVWMQRNFAEFVRRLGSLYEVASNTQEKESTDLEEQRKSLEERRSIVGELIDALPPLLTSKT